MAKFLLVAAAAVAMSSWAGGGGFIVAAQGSAIVFADDLKMPPLVSRDTPSCVAENNLDGKVCENDPDYDFRIEEYIKRLLKDNREVNALVSDPTLKTILNDVESDIINVRFSETEKPVCAAQETLIYPKRAKTPQNEWVFVPNQDGVQQAIRVEKCISDGSSCNVGTVPGDVIATCRQKYVYRRMLVLGTNKIEPEEVLMPSCCVCYTTYQGLFTRTANGTMLQPHDPAAPPTAAQPPRATQPMSGAASRPPVSLRFVRSRSHLPFFRYRGDRR